MSQIATLPINWSLERRYFLRCLTLALADVFAGCSQLVGANVRRPLRAGLVTVIHYADREENGTRFARQSPRGGGQPARRSG